MQTLSLLAKTLVTSLLPNPLVTPLLRCDLHSTMSAPSQERWSETLQQELVKQEWIYLKDSGKVEWFKAKDKHYENRDAVYDVKSLNFTQECRDAYFPSLTWRKL